MGSLCTWLNSLFQRPPWPAIAFPDHGFEIIEDSVIVEEESRPNFEDGDFYPVLIGDVLDSRYQVAGKLGFGVSSTVWLARDMRCVLKSATGSRLDAHVLGINDMLL